MKYRYKKVDKYFCGGCKLIKDSKGQIKDCIPCNHIFYNEDFFHCPNDKNNSYDTVMCPECGKTYQRYQLSHYTENVRTTFKRDMNIYWLLVFIGIVFTVLSIILKNKNYFIIECIVYGMALIWHFFNFGNDVIKNK